jgi:hypothetical protein
MHGSREEVEIKKIWHMYTMEYYSALKSGEILLFVETWRTLY